jgi:diketogulonate reductase-like aldo/keto reductase
MRPLGSGALAKELKEQPDLSPLAEYGITTWPQALLAWVLADPRIGILIPSSTRPERILQNAVAGTLPTLPPELREHIAGEAQRCFSG